MQKRQNDSFHLFHMLSIWHTSPTPSNIFKPDCTATFIWSKNIAAANGAKTCKNGGHEPNLSPRRQKTGRFKTRVSLVLALVIFHTYLCRKCVYFLNLTEIDKLRKRAKASTVDHFRRPGRSADGAQYSDAPPPGGYVSRRPGITISHVIVILTSISMRLWWQMSPVLLSGIFMFH